MTATRQEIWDLASSQTSALAVHAADAGLHGGAGGSSQAFPVGSVFLAVVSTDPASLLGYGTWATFGAGRMLVGRDPADIAFDVAEETGGAKTHTHGGHANHVVTQPAGHSQIITHTHPVTDPGHAHIEQNNSLTTGTLAGWAARDTSTATATATGYSTQPAATGVTTQAPVGGVASLAHTGAAVDAHSVHDSPAHLPPYIVVFMWKRTA